ncbi:MAG: MFS transporter [Pseudomonadota bacterium]|nr:MFS transporter [Pseudomonadota bacterium]
MTAASSAAEGVAPASPVLGLRENLPQFALLVLVNAFVGAMVGMERSVLPAIAEEVYGLAAKTAVLSFIVVFGVSKALTNYLAGRWSDAVGRKRVLVAGWLVALPVPVLLMVAPSWGWVLAANLLLGVSQGLTWSTTVIMKIDLAGPRQRGLAMGLNEFAGYLAVAGSALVTGWVAARYGIHPAPFALGIGYAAIGLFLSAVLVRETRGHVRREAALAGDAAPVSAREVFWRTTIGDRELSSVTQAGLVNNLNDGMAWGLFPLVFAAAGLDLAAIGALAALYPAVWGLAQLGTGAWSDRIGRKGLIAGGMLVQALGILAVAAGARWGGVIAAFVAGQVLLGLGTAMVYPTILAAIGDVAHPSWRASAVGVYRLWRDLGYAIGALLAGLVADAFGVPTAVVAVAILTGVSGVVVLVRMRETLGRGASAHPLAQSLIR